MKNKALIRFIFSFLFSLVLLLNSKIVYLEKLNIFSDIDFAPFSGIDFCFLFALILISYLFLILIEKIQLALISKNFKRNTSKKNFFLISFFLFLLAWLPYLLTYYPGGIFSDTFVSIKQLENIKEVGSLPLNNNQPLLYTLILKLCTEVGKGLIHNDLNGGILFFQWVQYFFCALCLAYFIHVLSKKDTPKFIIYLFISFFCFFPLIPFYVLSLWKDTIFHFVLFMYITCLLDALTNSNYFKNKRHIFLYCFLCFLVSFLRNNGPFIIIGTNLVLFFFIYKKEQKPLKKGIVGVTLATILIQGPLYSAFHLNGSPFIESMAIPFSQIAYSITHNTKLNEKQEKYINEIIPIDHLKKVYKPLLFDTIKWDNKFNQTFFSKNKKLFFKTWISLLPKNLKNYTKAYLLQTLGFWNPFKASEEGYVSLVTWPGYNEIMQRDIINDSFSLSLRNKLKPHIIISSAFFLWILFLSMYLILIQEKYKYLVICFPAFLSWLTIMLATPIAFSLRYVYILVLLFPLNLMLPFLQLQLNRK